jgi:hypothetical protein
MPLEPSYDHARWLWAHHSHRCIDGREMGRGMRERKNGLARGQFYFLVGADGAFNGCRPMYQDGFSAFRSVRICDCGSTAAGSTI